MNAPESTTTPRKRTLGDMSAQELVRTANDEMGGLDRKLQALLTGGQEITGTDLLIVNAYLGSVRSRLAVAESKMEAGE